MPSQLLPTMLQWLQQQHTTSMRVVDGQLFLLSTTITIFCLFFLASVRWSSKKSANKPPPSPPKLPLIGNLHQLGSLPHRSLRALSEKYGPLMLLHLGRVPTIVVSSAELAREVMKTHDLAFASRPPMSIISKIFYGAQDVAFAPYGEYWRHAKRTCVLHLLSLRKVQSFRAVREEEMALFLDKIRAASPNKVNLSRLLMSLTKDLICRVAFGTKYTEETGEGGHLFRILAECMALLGTPPIKDFLPWFSWIDSLSGLDARVQANSGEIDAFIEKVLEDHRLQAHDHHQSLSDQKNIIDVLLELAKDEDAVHLNIKAVVLDMFAAGTDTTYTVLEWTMAELIRHPEVMEKAQDEVRAIVGRKENASEEDIGGMSYLKAVIKEAMRLHPPLPLLVPRETVEDVELKGYLIPAGTRVMVNAWAIGRDEQSWDGPEEFLPERFMKSSVDFRGQDFQLIPFGAGRRGCPGIEFANHTMELVLANLLYHFDWAMPGGEKGEDLDMIESAGLATHKKCNLVLTANPRLN